MAPRDTRDSTHYSGTATSASRRGARARLSVKYRRPQIIVTPTAAQTSKIAAAPLYAGAVAWSSALLFVVQPIMAKSLLPRFGGSASVWIACMLFFQLVLLLGYFYSFCLTRYLGLKAQALVHLGLLT